MAVNRDPILKKCRSLGIEPTWMGIHKESDRQPKKSNKKMSNYGMQLREKQKAKFIYGVLEKQFRNTFKKAEKKKGLTGENLLIMLESRLDNIVFRLGFASSRREARQLVTHGHFMVNGKKVDIPSYACKAGDTIQVKEKSINSPKFKEMKGSLVAVPAWLSTDLEKFEGKVIELPNREQIDVPVDEQLIVELYSK